MPERFKGCVGRQRHGKAGLGRVYWAGLEGRQEEKDEKIFAGVEVDGL